MGIVEQLIQVDRHLLTKYGRVMPAEDRVAFQLLNEATLSADKEAACKVILHKAIDTAHYSHVEKTLNLAFFVFNDRSILVFYGENNGSFASSCLNQSSLLEISTWLREQDIDPSLLW